MVRKLAVVYDHAEQGVAHIEDLKRCLTKDGEQLHFLLQVEADHRMQYQDSRKLTLAQTRRQ